jgi:hypothetical protein
VDEFLRLGYNPFAKSWDSERVSAEWDGTLHLLSEQLRTRWTIGVGAEDALVDLDLGTDRMISVELSNLDLLNPSLPSIAYNAVAVLPGDYCVDFCDAWGYMHTSTGEPYPHFNLLVTKSEVWLYSESDTLISSLDLEAVIKNPGPRTLLDLRM